MVTESFNSIKAHINQWLSSPLFGAFIISWIIFNYRFLLVVVSDLPIDEKLNFIDCVIYPNFWWLMLWTALAPFAVSILGILAYPIPAHRIYKYTLEYQKKLNQIKQEIDDETLLTKEQSIKARREVAERETVYETEFDKLTTKIENLKRQLDSAMEDRRTAEQALAKMEEKPSKLEEAKGLIQIQQEVIKQAKESKSRLIPTLEKKSPDAEKKNKIIISDLSKNETNILRALNNAFNFSQSLSELSQTLKLTQKELLTPTITLLKLDLIKFEEKQNGQMILTLFETGRKIVVEIGNVLDI